MHETWITVNNVTAVNMNYFMRGSFDRDIMFTSVEDFKEGTANGFDKKKWESMNGYVVLIARSLEEKEYSQDTEDLKSWWHNYLNN